MTTPQPTSEETDITPEETDITLGVPVPLHVSKAMRQWVREPMFYGPQVERVDALIKEAEEMRRAIEADILLTNLTNRLKDAPLDELRAINEAVAAVDG